jgi:hypothetical protein
VILKPSIDTGYTYNGVRIGKSCICNCLEETFYMETQGRDQWTSTDLLKLREEKLLEQRQCLGGQSKQSFISV